MWLLTFGYLGLFAGTFLAATLLPLPSEALLLGAFELDLNVIMCLTIATVGNFLGGITNYIIGYKCNNKRLIEKLKIDEEKLAKQKNLLDKWGYWLGFISWVPFVGDPLIVVLGFYKVRLIPLLITMFVGKFLRYLVVALMYLNWFVF